MIHYPITHDELKRRVNARFPASRNRDGTRRANGREAWLTRATHLTAHLKADGVYNVADKDEIWTELKRLFAEIQGDGKCAYCERKLAVHKRGGPKGDIDHYRPKRGVASRPGSHQVSEGGSEPNCYYLLAFHLRNYLLSCEICNRDFKKNYFPIAGPRCSANSTRLDDLKAERPYLLHPLNRYDADPEELIEFQGIVPVPKTAQGTHNYWRAFITIEMLGLTRGERADLDAERTMVIEALYMALTSVNQSDPVVKSTLKTLQDNAWPHRNCARSFKRLYETDQALATRFAEEARKFIDSRSKSRTKPL